VKSRQEVQAVGNSKIIISIYWLLRVSAFLESQSLCVLVDVCMGRDWR
jgi:hypothetical protein